MSFLSFKVVLFSKSRKSFSSFRFKDSCSCLNFVLSDYCLCLTSNLLFTVSQRRSSKLRNEVKFFVSTYLDCLNIGWRWNGLVFEKGLKFRGTPRRFLFNQPHSGIVRWYDAFVRLKTFNFFCLFQRSYQVLGPDCALFR